MKKSILKTLSKNEVLETVKNLKYNFSSSEILLKAGEELSKFKIGRTETNTKQNISQAMSLYEFENAGLMATGISEEYRTFANEFSKNLQLEFGCQKESEKSIAHITSLNFVRILDIQCRIKSYLNKGAVTDTGIAFLNIMSKELDRAENHYLASLNELRSMRMPKLSMSIKTNTAVVGSNQMIQVRDS